MWKILFLLGRVALVALFIYSGVGKFMNLNGLAGQLTAKGLPFGSILAPVVAGVEVAAAALIAVGFQTRIAALVLVAFTIAATVLFHNFWDMQGAARTANLIHAYKNLSIIGALLILAAAGAGPYAVSKR